MSNLPQSREPTCQVHEYPTVRSGPGPNTKVIRTHRYGAQA